MFVISNTQVWYLPLFSPLYRFCNFSLFSSFVKQWAFYGYKRTHENDFVIRKFSLTIIEDKILVLLMLSIFHFIKCWHHSRSSSYQEIKNVLFSPKENLVFSTEKTYLCLKLYLFLHCLLSSIFIMFRNDGNTGLNIWFLYMLFSLLWQTPLPSISNII